MNPRLETAQRLLAKAREDRYAMARMLDDSAGPIGPLGFHAQQAVEKALKAALAAHGTEFPLTHNIAMLLASLTKEGLDLPPDAAELPKLTPFAVAFRYDDAGEPAQVNLDRAWLRDCVDRSLAWAEAQMGTGDNAP